MLINVNKKLMLDDYEISVLKKYNIDRIILIKNFS